MAKSQRTPIWIRRRIIERYENGETVSAVAKKTGVSRTTVRSVIRKAGVKLRPYHDPLEYRPTAEQIESEAALIRETWSDEEYIKRCVGNTPDSLGAIFFASTRLGCGHRNGQPIMKLRG